MFRTPILTGEGMQFKEIGGIRLFRPRLQTVILERNDAERHMRESYASGSYVESQKINHILQNHFRHFYQKLSSEIPRSASRRLFEFLLAQYDRAAEIESHFKQGQLTEEDVAYWIEHGPVVRRSLKHLAELVTALAPLEAPTLPRPALLQNLETVIICAEMLVTLYMLSDQTYALHPDETVLSILPEGGQIYWDLKVQGHHRFDDFRERISVDTQSRSKYLGPQPNLDPSIQCDELDAALEADLGISWSDAILALDHLINTSIVQPGSFDVPFVRRESIVDGFHEDMKWAKKSVELLLDGFSVSRAGMQDEGRAIYKPKQEYRALRRGFFEMPHETGPHITWSRCMARECLMLLIDGAAFQRFPPEWRSPSTNQALARLQQKAGKWFEREVERNLSTLGALGSSNLKRWIGTGDTRIEIPSEVGELDYLGYFPTEAILIVLECKMVDSGHEPSYLRDDVSSFVNSNNSYAKQLSRKTEWVRVNIDKISTALASTIEGRPLIRPSRVAGALVTLYPTYASYFIADYPCVALSELMADFDARGEWPYEIGVFDVP